MHLAVVMRRVVLTLSLAGGLVGPVIAGHGTLPANIAAAANEPARGALAADDARRHGPAILAFIRVRRGESVVDLIPGSGYWSELFARAVGPGGVVYGIWPTQLQKFDQRAIADYRHMAGEPAFANIVTLEQPAEALTVPKPVDVVFTSQNYHDYANPFMAPASPDILNRAAFRALRHGGSYVVIDHVAETGSGLHDTSTLHRIDPTIVKAQVTAAGFRFVSASMLLHNPADDHSRKVFDPAIRGMTDQFIFKFRKP